MSGEKTLDRVNLQIFPQCEHEIGGKEEEECGPQPIVYFKHREKRTVIIGSLTHGKVVMWSTMPNVRGTCRFLVVCKRKIGDKEEEKCMQQPTRRLGVSGAPANETVVCFFEWNCWHCWNAALYWCQVIWENLVPPCQLLVAGNCVAKGGGGNSHANGTKLQLCA